MGVKQKKQPPDSPEVAKIVSLRSCFREIGDLKFACLVFVLLCILKSRTCNLNRAADFGPSSSKPTKPASDYARLCRFFATGIGEELQKGVFRAVLRLALQSGSPAALVMDRTDWELGKTSWCNLLAIGLSFKGYFIPLVWADLGRRGNSGAAVRLALVDRLLEWWPYGEVSPKEFPLLADREFAGEQWLLDLAKRGFLFVVRIKSNRKLALWLDVAIRERLAGARALRRFLARKGLNTTQIVLADEYICHFVALKNTAGRDKEPWVYLFTNLDEPNLAGDFYRLRWTIECCFKHLKSNGFNLEDHAFVKPHHIDIVMAVVVLLYTLCMLGAFISLHDDLEQNRTPRTKKYRNGKTYPAKSVFRTGLTQITQLASSKPDFLSFVNDLFHWFSPAYIFT